MTFVSPKNRVFEIATVVSPGTGNFTRAGAVPDYFAWDHSTRGVGVGNSSPYWALEPNTGNVEWGVGSVTTLGFTRDTIYGGSNGTSPVAFTAGTNLWLLNDLPAELMVGKNPSTGEMFPDADWSLPRDLILNNLKAFKGKNTSGVSKILARVTSGNRASFDEDALGALFGGDILLAQAAAKIIGGSTSLALRNNADSADNFKLTDAGIALLRAAIATSAAAGDLVAANAKGVRGTNAAGTATKSLIQLNAADLVLLDADAVGVLLGAALKFAATASKIIGGATSLSLRNNADSADNLILTDAGNGTLRGDLQVNGAAVSQNGWTAPSFTNSWSGATVAYRKINGMVEMKGILGGSGTADTSAFALPSGFRPPTDSSFLALRGDTGAAVEIWIQASTGQVKPQAGSSASPHLETIRFYP